MRIDMSLPSLNARSDAPGMLRRETSTGTVDRVCQARATRSVDAP